MSAVYIDSAAWRGTYTDAVTWGTPVVPPPPTGQGGGASGAYRYPVGNLDLETWRRKGRRLEARVEKLQKQIQAKRERIEETESLERIKELKKQIVRLQKRLLELLAEIDLVNKGMEEEEVMSLYAAYTAWKALH